MTLISDIEDAIIAKLEPLRTQNNCAITKLDKQALSRPRSGNEVFVNYEGRNSGDPEYLDEPIFQFDELEFEVMTSVMELRTHETAYPILEKVRALLTGFKPVGCVRPLVMLGRETLIKKFIDEGIWAYSQKFRMTVEFTQTENLDG